MLLLVKDLNRFWSKVEKTKGGCWLWTAGTFVTGYGAFKLGGKMLSTHRLSYEISNGPIPKGLHVIHSCDVPRCVNPNHLRAGTNAENVRDRQKRGREARGEQHGKAKLTEKQIKRIRQQHGAGKTQKELAKKYGVTRQTISKIVLRKRWAYVD